MKTILKAFVLAVALLMCNTVSSAATKDKELKALRKVLVQETANYYKSEGLKRNQNTFRPYIYSAMRVSRMFPVYPADSDVDRMLKFYSFGAKESGFKRNFAIANIPGATYMGGKMHVKRFSVDYGADGLNICNVASTYTIACCIQSGDDFPKWLNLNAKTKAMFRQCTIPEDLELKQIDISTYWNARKEWIRRVRLGQKPDYIRKQIKISFPETQTDDIDSMLIYRVIVEIERMNYGWSYENYDKELYDFLSEFVD